MLDERESYRARSASAFLREQRVGGGSGGKQPSFRHRTSLLLSIRATKLAQQGSPAPVLIFFSLFPFFLPAHAHKKRSQQKQPRKPFKISPIAADALAGAAGEIAQLSSLYPLDTVKVVQQAADCSLGGALKLLAPAGARPASVLAALYRGCLPACVASAAVGAVYLVSFGGAQRAWERAAVRGGRGGGGGGGGSRALSPATVACSSSSSSSASSSSDSDDGLEVPLGPTSPSSFVPFASLTVSAAVVASSESHHSHHHSSSPSSAASSSTSSSHPQSVPAHIQAEAATAGAIVASVATSLMEAPLELFRHRAQAVVVGGGGGAAAAAASAGASSGSVLAQASAAFAAGGVKELYRGLAPYVLKSAPYDMSELLVYSMLRGRGGGGAGGMEGGAGGGMKGGGETSVSASSDSSVFSLLPATMRPQPQLAHAVLGAVAGAAAVVASMPADCIKLKLELSSAPVTAGIRESVGQFFGTGTAIATGPGGPSALFRGMGPRLAEKVPSTMIYWVVVEAARKALAPHVDRGEEEEEAAAVPLAALPTKKQQLEKKKSFFRRSSSSQPSSAAASSSSSGGDFVVA